MRLSFGTWDVRWKARSFYHFKPEIMKNKQLFFSMLIAGMTLGTTWAIRGQFGHEYGAAWAGAVGGLGILLLAKRQDWYPKMFKVVLAAAIGWGLGGMMSYGIVVGYGRGIDFGNVYYGLLMLFVIGGLYGFIGGGLFGLALTDSSEQRIKWHQVIVEMIAGGVIVYFFFIMQWEWLMTPPRSELWAACLGMALALTWYMAREKHAGALKVAVYAGLGGGFGFAFGNFLQTLGTVAEIQFNMWNVMEYSLGFFGGAGMAYGVFTSEWTESDLPEMKSSNMLPALLLVAFIPLVVWQQSFDMEKLVNSYKSLVEGDPEVISRYIRLSALILLILFIYYVIRKNFVKVKSPVLSYEYADANRLFIGLFGLYIIYTFIRTGAFLSFAHFNHYLYIANLLIILWALPGIDPGFIKRESKPTNRVFVFLILVAIMAVLAFIAINTHGEMPGMQLRFE